MEASRSALVIVDVQRDFCPGGALPVPDGGRVVPVLNRYAAGAADHGLVIYASRDWHPEVTSHFNTHGGKWPPHCIQHSAGAAFHPDLRLPSSMVVISKGDDPAHPGYSIFDGHTTDGRPLLQELRDRRIDHLHVGGLATEYCVRASVLDARRYGLSVTVLDDAIAGIDVRRGDVSRAIDEMRAAGATFASWGDWPFRFEPTT